MPEDCRCAAARATRPEVNRVALDRVTATELPSKVETFLDCGRSHVVHFCPADPTVRARGDERYRALLNAGDLNVPDGMSVVWALRLFGHQAERIAGSDALELLSDWGRARGVRHYFYGGLPGIGERLGAYLETTYPGVAVAGCESPPFDRLTDDELQEAAGRIRASGADLLWIGLGTPKQDFVAERLRTDEAAPVILCVGAAFDFLSGEKKRAPLWMQRAGLEWAHRLASEPRRLWRRYLIGNTRFLAGVLADRLALPRRSGE